MFGLLRSGLASPSESEPIIIHGCLLNFVLSHYFLVIVLIMLFHAALESSTVRHDSPYCGMALVHILVWVLVTHSNQIGWIRTKYDEFASSNHLEYLHKKSHANRV